MVLEFLLKLFWILIGLYIIIKPNFNFQSQCFWKLSCLMDIIMCHCVYELDANDKGSEDWWKIHQFYQKTKSEIFDVCPTCFGILNK